MTGAFFKKSISFYATLFGLWAVFLLAKYHDHRYEESPVPSAGLEQSAGDGTNAAALQAKVSALRQELTTAATNARKSFVLQEIGFAYANLFNATGNVLFRDSAVNTMREASEENPGNGRLHYSLGKFYEAIGDPKEALEQYRLAVRYDSTYVPALADAAACSFFSFNRSVDAKRYGSLALRLDGKVPLCRLILGLIDLDAGKIASGREYLEQELVADDAAMTKGNTSVGAESIRFAASTAHYRLMQLYCSRVPDQARAREHLDGYLRFETDNSRKSAAIEAMKKRWGGAD